MQQCAQTAKGGLGWGWSWCCDVAPKALCPDWMTQGSQAETLKEVRRSLVEEMLPRRGNVHDALFASHVAR